MRAKYLKFAAVFVLTLSALIACVDRNAQAQDKPGAAQLNTNWVGGLVVGKKERGDPIAGPGLFPHAESEIEIGLRSDGVVVWRPRQLVTRP